MTNTLSSPKYGYIAPTYRMAKQTAWSYLMEYTGTIPNVHYHETELRVDFLAREEYNALERMPTRICEE